MNDVFVKRLVIFFANTLALHSVFQFRESDKITLPLTRKKIEDFNEQYMYNAIDSFRILSYSDNLNYLVEYPIVLNISYVLVSYTKGTAFNLCRIKADKLYLRNDRRNCFRYAPEASLTLQ
jgi:hypothetical protein